MDGDAKNERRFCRLCLGIGPDTWYKTFHHWYTASPHLFSGAAKMSFARVVRFCRPLIESGLKKGSSVSDYASTFHNMLRSGAGGVITDWKGHQLHWEASSTSRATSMF
ncbi:inositol monophosphatase [Striga asiatica]|uniref:Inositol monophosphatase n=1 Tax=Striga asiatica TaxID=4170 RepID=A0A5A7R242_STRAF|nr:inositol monophosphatase [Striga asiatica]